MPRLISISFFFLLFLLVLLRCVTLLGINWKVQGPPFLGITSPIKLECSASRVYQHLRYGLIITIFYFTSFAIVPYHAIAFSLYFNTTLSIFTLFYLLCTIMRNKYTFNLKDTGTQSTRIYTHTLSLSSTLKFHVRLSITPHLISSVFIPSNALHFFLTPGT